MIQIKYSIIATLILSVSQTVYADNPPDLEKSLQSAASHRDIWDAALRDVPSTQRDSLIFLLIHMPQQDLRNLSEEFVLEHIRLAHEAFNQTPWKEDVPLEIFQNAVLPYASVNEARESFRKYFREQFGPIVKDCKTPGEAALVLNSKIFGILNVQYHPTKRPKPDQSPSESIAAGYASCSGLSILLIDACRSVGIPARMVGTPEWFTGQGDANGNHGGNHSWVEIWDGQWHILGASEVSELDKTWFMENASKQNAQSAKPEYRIYTSTWQKTGIHFPLVWDETIDWVNAEDVTADYANRDTFTVHAPPDTTHITIHQNKRLIASIPGPSAKLTLSKGQKYTITLEPSASDFGFTANLSDITVAK